MTEVQKEILNRLFPDYERAKEEIQSYSDYELYLIRDNDIGSIHDLSDTIIKEVQWDIAGSLFSQLINNWDDFYYENESIIMDYCQDCSFLGYNEYYNCYELSETRIIEICKEMIDQAEGEYSINEEVDFRDVISNLNKLYLIKFCEVYDTRRT